MAHVFGVSRSGYLFKSLFLIFCWIFTTGSSSTFIQKTQELLLAPDIQAIKNRDRLRVAMHKVDQPPFFMVDQNGDLIGFDVDLAKDIAYQLNVELEINRDSKSFKEIIDRVARGDADVAISKMSVTLDGAQAVRYSKPYLVMHKAVLLNRDELVKFGSTLSLQDLFKTKKAKMGVITASSYQEFASEIFPNAHIYDSPSWNNDIIPKLIKGELLGAFRDELEVRRTMLILENAPLYLLAVMIEDETDPMMMAINEKSPMLQLWLNIYIDQRLRVQNIYDVIEQYKEYVYKVKTK